MKGSILLMLLFAYSCSVSPNEDVALNADNSVDAVQEVAAYRVCEHAAPGELVPMYRAVPDDLDPVAAALRAVLEGVNEEERGRGCTSFFSQSTADALRLVSHSSAGDTIHVDFENFSGQIPDVPGARSFLPPGVMAELTWTIFGQFPEIDAVRFSFDGDEQAFWQWVGGRGTEAQVYTRTMWEQI